MTWPTVWDALAIGSFYEQHAWAVDSIIYLIMFTGAAQVTLGSTYTGRGGRAMVAAIGAALTVGAATLAYQTGFTLAALGPLAWLILLGLLGLMLFRLVRSMGLARLPAACLAILVMFASAAGLGQALTPWLADTGLMLPVQLLALFALIALVWWIASHIHQLPKPSRPQSFDSRSSTWFDLSGPPDSSASSAESSQATPEDRDIQAVVAVDASIRTLLAKLLHHIKRTGPTHTSRHLLKEIKRRERIVSMLYKRVLRHLARMQWKARSDRQQLPRELKTLLADVKDNVSEFERTLELAIISHDQHNIQLLMASVERLIMLEEAALQHAVQLRDVLQRMKQPSEAMIAVSGR